MTSLRFVLRTLLKTPGFSFLAILMLGLGIGASTAIFTAIDAVMLRPLPYPEPSQLVGIWERTPMFNLYYSPFAFGNYNELKVRCDAFADMGAAEEGNCLLRTNGRAEELRLGIVTASLFRTLGVPCAIGRYWNEGEDLAGQENTVVLSHQLWVKLFASDPSVIGRRITLGEKSGTVIGVMPASFQYPSEGIALWAPMGSYFPASAWVDYGRHNLSVVGRLKPGRSLAEANAQLAAASAALAEKFPETNKNVGAFSAPLNQPSSAEVKQLYLVLLGMTFLVQAIACANLANMMLARVVNRWHDYAIRLSLGATRRHLAQQVLLECLLLSFCGGLLGLALAGVGNQALQPLLPKGYSVLMDTGSNLRIFAWAFGSVMLTSLATGCAVLIPMLRMTRMQSSGLSPSRSGVSPRTKRFQMAFVVLQLALCFTLVAGAGLLIRTFSRLSHVDLGFKPDNTLVVNLSSASLDLPKYQDPLKREALYNDILRQVEALPGVNSAGFTLGPPIVFKGWKNGIVSDSEPTRMESINYRVVTPGVFKALGMPLLKGRLLGDLDTRTSPLVALVNDAMARKLWPNADPIGRRFHFGTGSDPWISVVGIVGDTRQYGLQTSSEPEMYLPSSQQGAAPCYLILRSSSDPLLLRKPVEELLRSIDADIAVPSIEAMNSYVSLELSPRRVQVTLMNFFASIAVFMAAAGLFGLVSYSVTQRQREFGIRTALGARPASIVALVLRGTLISLGLGLLLGIILFSLSARLMEGLLFGVSRSDPLSIAVSIVVMSIVAIAAGLLPARRAVQSNPIELLRSE